MISEAPAKPRWQVSALSLLGAVVAWEAVARSGIVPRALFPTPTDVVAAFGEWAAEGTMVLDFATSLGRALLGYSIGCIFGLVVGVASGRSAIIDAVVSPIVQALRPIPPVAIIPLVILWAGIGDGAKIYATAFAVFFPVWVAAHVGSRGVPRVYVWSGRMLGASAWRQLWAIVLPSALPTIIAGLRMGVATAFVMVFVTELAGASNGLGYQIALTQSAYRIDRMVAALALLAFAAAATDYLQVAVLRAIFPWLALAGR